MLLSLPEESQPVQEMFEKFFAAEATPARVRSAEPVGFDPELWNELLALEAPLMRLSPEAGGGGMSLFDACVMMGEAGRRLAPAPLAEAVVALRILGELGGDVAREWIEKVRSGEAVLSLALRQAKDGKPQIVPGGAVAHGVLVFDGDQVAIEVPSAPLEAPHTLGGAAAGVFIPGQGERHVVASNADAERVWQAGIEEWKLLTSAALIGLSREALEMASAYAAEREAFGQKIGTYQGLAHPLAVDVIDADGAHLYLWWTLRALAEGKEDAGANVSLLYWWAARNASTSLAHALHTYGGYGLTNEYDIQLYHRRAKSWPLAMGDPDEELVRGGRRLLLGEEASLPDPGLVEVNFDNPDSGNALADETREVFAVILDPAVHRLHEANFESHSWEVHRAMGKAGLLFPDWPSEWGGRGADGASARASARVWSEVGYAGLARSVTAMAGAMVQKFGTQELKDEVLLAMASGEITTCLGFTEPSGGSDVFAAKTRAVRDGDDWVINGQKMFTSGAELASYVLLLTRTDPDVPKHKGLTLFLCPLKVDGVEVHPVHTFVDERTNATFYQDVRISDRYRLGDVNGGVRSMSAALGMEQGGSYYYAEIRKMLSAVIKWAAGEERDGVSMLEHPATLARLGKLHAQACIGEALTGRALWNQISGGQDQAYGPASKIFNTQAFIEGSADLLDLAAPFSMIRGKQGLGVVEMGYRHSTATSIYGGTSEVLRSMVAERRLGLPRSRA